MYWRVKQLLNKYEITKKLVLGKYYVVENIHGNYHFLQRYWQLLRGWVTDPSSLDIS